MIPIAEFQKSGEEWESRVVEYERAWDASDLNVKDFAIQVVFFL